MPARKMPTAPRSTRFRPRPGLASRAVLVRELTDGAEVDLVLLVRDAELRSRRDGGQYLRMTLCDKTGSLTAVVWDGVAECAPHARAGEPVRVAGRFGQHPRRVARPRRRPPRPPPALRGAVEGPRAPAARAGDVRPRGPARRPAAGR